MEVSNIHVGILAYRLVEPYERVISPSSQVELLYVKCADLNRLAGQLRLGPAR